jgi:copper transport protein
MTSVGRGRTAGAALLLAVAAVLAVAAPAAAHAVLVSSDPVDGSRLDASPARVTLHFDETVQLAPGGIRALSTDGTRVDTAQPRQTDHGTSIVLPLRPDLPRGSYTVTWRVVSADTHVVTGSISFGVRQNARSVTAATTAPLTPVDAIADAATGLGYLGAVLAFGLAAAGRLLWPWSLRTRRLRLLGWIGGGALAIGTLLELLLQGPRATGSGLAGALQFDDLGQTLASGSGVALVVRLALLAALALARPWRATAGPASWLPRLLLAVAVLVTIAVPGHAGAGPDAAIAIPVATLHLAAMCLWLGGLVSLAAIVLPRWKAAGRIHPRLVGSWSLAAFVSVAVLILTGEYQAWREVQPVPSLWSTGYGITLLVKIGLVIAALLVALAVRHRWIVPRPSAAIGYRALRRSIAIETAIVALVVGVTTVLVAQPPASTAYGPAASLSAPLGADTVEVSIDTTRHGPQRITITALDSHREPVALTSVSGVLSSDDAEVAGLDVAFRPGDGLSWSSTAAVAPLAGHWKLVLDVAIKGGGSYATSTGYDVW